MALTSCCTLGAVGLYVLSMLLPLLVLVLVWLLLQSIGQGDCSVLVVVTCCWNGFQPHPAHFKLLPTPNMALILQPTMSFQHKSRRFKLYPALTTMGSSTKCESNDPAQFEHYCETLATL